MSQLIDRELAAALRDERAALEDVFAEALRARDTDAFFEQTERGVRAIARSDALPGTRLERLLRELAAKLRRYQDEGFGELEALEDLADRFAQEGLAEAAPIVGGVAARALASPLARRGGAPLPRPLRQQLVRSGRQAAQVLARRQGPQALRAMPAIVRQTQRVATAQNLPGQALPAAMRSVTARAALNPGLVRQLAQARLLTRQRGILAAGTTRPSDASDIRIPPDVIKPADARVDKFNLDSVALQPFQVEEINRIAGKIADSWLSRSPIRTVRVIGHTDPSGSPNHNMGLGRRRAMAVRKELMSALNRKQRNLGYKVLILAGSKGATELIDTTGTPDGQARNRRVEVFLSTKALRPLPQTTGYKRRRPSPIRGPVERVRGRKRGGGFLTPEFVKRWRQAYPQRPIPTQEGLLKRWMQTHPHSIRRTNYPGYAATPDEPATSEPDTQKKEYCRGLCQTEAWSKRSNCDPTAEDYANCMSQADIDLSLCLNGCEQESEFEFEEELEWAADEMAQSASRWIKRFGLWLTSGDSTSLFLEM